MRINPTLLDALKARSEAEQTTVTELVVKYIMLGLRGPVDAPISASEFQEMKAQVSELRVKLTA